MHSIVKSLMVFCLFIQIFSSYEIEDEINNFLCARTCSEKSYRKIGEYLNFDCECVSEDMTRSTLFKLN